MKKLLIIPTILFSATVFAQTKLPEKVTFSLTDKQIIKLSTSIDSLYLALQSSDLPARTVAHLVNQSQVALDPIWKSARSQMIDTTKKKK
jgi:hypothetical protein